MLYGRKAGSYELYRDGPPVTVRCEAKPSAGASFSLHPSLPSFDVYGPSPLTYTINIAYSTPSSALQSMISGSQSCYQEIRYNCNKTAGGSVEVFDNSSLPLTLGTCSTSCRCKIAGSAVARETETFTDKTKLPIKKIIVQIISTWNEFISIEVGKVICEESKKLMNNDI